ncbi:serine/threonine-protein kinase [Curtobacterium sp. MCPF17_052]|uniref:protein kinase domain-containing protein n=1 Tax=Curtobacterium sp. MCPF17_052 TaxID=2175655 RepID=UPI0024DFC286|nr:serine/threonine-protein kinase [Curtobacterium sp. MCPF17_052]WIB13586.1 serine/threonine-protein kinase [Curtobacterium sp. MCPF17_052]
MSSSRRNCCGRNSLPNRTSSNGSSANARCCWHSTTPSIVRVRDLVVEGDRLAIVMDLVGGGSARDLLLAVGTLPPSDALTITAETLDALAVAHERDVSHRDVKPDNVLLDHEWTAGSTGDVRVSDFGIASVVAERDRKTTGLLGTPQYMAPESISQGRSGPAADVYGAGVMLYELLSGRTPFAGPGTDFAVAYRHVTSAPPRLDVPDALWAALSSLLAKEPAARPSAVDAAATLRRLARSLRDTPALERVDDPDAFDEVERPATVVRGGVGAASTGTAVAETGSGGSGGPALVAAEDGAVEPGPDLGPAGSQTVIRPLARPVLPAAPAEVESTRRRFTRPDWFTNRMLLLGIVGIMLVVVLVIAAVVWLPGAGKKRPGGQRDRSAECQCLPAGPTAADRVDHHAQGRGRRLGRHRRALDHLRRADRAADRAPARGAAGRGEGRRLPRRHLEWRGRHGEAEPAVADRRRHRLCVEPVGRRRRGRWVRDRAGDGARGRDRVGGQGPARLGPGPGPGPLAPVLRRPPVPGRVARRCRSGSTASVPRPPPP